MSPSSLSNTELMASVPPFKHTTHTTSAAIACFVVAFALFAWAAALLWVRAGLLLVPLILWLALLVPWYRRRAALSAAAQQRGMYQALGVWAITDLTVLLVFAR